MSSKIITDCDLDTPVPDWIIDHPQSLALFKELGIDYSCGGKSLGYVCRQRGLDPNEVFQELQRRIGPLTGAVVASIQVGLPQSYGREGADDPMDRPWSTGYVKRPVAGPLWLGATNLAGDGQADLAHHGGPDKAVLAYAAAHYAYWRSALSVDELPFGAFGENFTVEGLTEAEVCIGDTYRVGDVAVVQVSQPRQPCWKLARRWRIKTLAAQVQQTGKTGWYLRVLEEGGVQAGMPMTLLARPHPTWSVARANRVMHAEKHDLEASAELAALPELSSNWRKTLTRRAEGTMPDAARRLIGQNE